MCTGRIDLAFILRAFAQGADGVFIGGCWPGECHYITEGNYDALSNTHLGKKLLTHIGVDPERLTLQWIAASEGSRFAEVTTGFVQQLKALGPLSSAEEAEGRRLKRTFDAVGKLVPYLKLVERERMRVPDKSEQAYEDFFSSDEFGRLFDSLIADKLAISQITSLLADGPLSTVEIAESLSLSPSAVSKHMNSTSRQGLVTYDVDQRRYALA
jgi:F420-non-reducing hydrogenase iron-sulfur subunit